MGKIIFKLEDDLDEQFRKTIADVKGLHRGVIQASLVEAVEDWIKHQRRKNEKRK